MRIDRLQITNLFSYKKAELKLEDYNVIVGTSGSGKTNIIRILQLIAGYDTSRRANIPPLDQIALSPQNRTFEGKSAIRLDVTLSEKETAMLVQLICRRDLPKINTEAYNKLTLIVSWPDSIAETIWPDFIIVRMGNGFTVLNAGRDITYTAEAPDNTLELVSKVSSIPLMKKEEFNQFSNYYQFNAPELFKQERFFNDFLNGGNIRQYVDVNGIRRLGLSTNFEIGYDVSNPARHQKEIFEYCKMRKEQPSTVGIMFLMRNILRNSITFIPEIRPDYNALATELFDYKTASQTKSLYDRVISGFSQMFAGVKADVFLEQNPNDPDGTKRPPHFVEITEGGQKFRLERSASGYFEALFLFSRLSSTDEGVIVLDEPALHLHPIKIRYLGRTLIEMAKSQAMIVTHSPYFVNTRLFKDKRGLAKVHKQAIIEDNKMVRLESVITNKPENFELTLKAHLLNPEVFFNNVTVVVEGPSDEAAMRAISDSLNDAFGIYDVGVVNAGSLQNVKSYSKLVAAYKLEHVIMVDHVGLQEPINSIKANTALDVTVLNEDLEHDLGPIGWDYRQKLEPEKAYDFVLQKMKDGRNEVRTKTQLGQVFSRAMEKAGANADEIWKTQLSE